MKKFYFLTGLLLASLLGSQLYAQAPTDTVSMGPGYGNQVYYRLSDGKETSVVANNWDLAFEISGFTAAIRVNTRRGAALYSVPNTDNSGWSTMDTAGFNSWKQIYDTDTSWRVGAFNRTADFSDPFDLGWGMYDLVTHFVTGDSLYVIKTVQGNYKKLRLDRLASGVYSFTYANLDGTDEVSDNVDKGEFTDKNFGYYSLDAQQSLDREPVSSEWDLVFTGYMGFLNNPVFPYYGVTGVLTNTMNGTQSVELTTNDVANSTDAGLTYNNNISTIGYDWKRFAGGWSLSDSTVYFIKSSDGGFYKLVFVDFGGSTDGNFIFNKEMMRAASISPAQTNINALSVYPNPASERANVLVDLKSSDFVRLSLVDMSGKMIQQQAYELITGSHRLDLDLGQAAPGMYLVVVTTSQGRSINKLSIY